MLTTITKEEQEISAKVRLKNTFNALLTQARQLQQAMKGNVFGVTPERLREIMGEDYALIEGKIASLVGANLGGHPQPDNKPSLPIPATQS